jgi:hypothetical protein
LAVLFVANSRKSISSSPQRQNEIGTVADELLVWFEQQPKPLKYVTPASLCLIGYPGIMPIHFKQQVDTSPFFQDQELAMDSSVEEDFQVSM